MAELKHLPSTSSVDSILEVLERDAGVIIDNIVNSDFLVELNEELNPFLSSDNLGCLLYTSPSPRDATLSRMPSSA